MHNQLIANLPAVYSKKPSVLNITETNTERLSPWTLESSNISSYHYHNAIEIGYCFRGRGEHYTKNGVFPFQEGDALFIIPGHPHYTINAPQTKSKWMFLYFDMEELLKSTFQQANLSNAEVFNPEITLYDIISHEHNPKICQMILRIIKQYQTFLPGRNNILCAQFMELLFSLSRECGTLPGCRIRPIENYGKLNVVIQHIQNAINSGHIPSVEELAPLCYMSTSNFRKVFRETVGCAPHDYIIQIAVQRAQKLLLSSDRSVLEISSEVGFQSVTSLNRNFVAHCGMTPNTYRQVHQSLY